MEDFEHDLQRAARDRDTIREHDLPVGPGQDPEHAADDYLRTLAKPCAVHPDQLVTPASRGVLYDWNRATPSQDPEWRASGGRRPAFVLKTAPGLCFACAAHARLTSYGVPKLFREASFENFTADTDELRHNLKVCRQYAANPAGFLVTLGRMGNGKTHLAAAILRAARHRARYIRHLDAVEVMRERYGKQNYDDTPSIRHTLRDAGLLVIDEIGIGKSGNDADVLMHDIIDHRYAEMLPTVICCNVPADGLKDSLGDRITDRIRHAIYGGKPLLFNSPSRRASLNVEYFK